jgi:hypothetical protein
MFLVIQILSYFGLISFFALGDDGNTQRSKFLVIIFNFLIFILFFITGFRNRNYVTDYESYILLYNSKNILIEPSFVLLKYIFKTILDAPIKWFMLCYAILAISIKAKVFKELTEYQYLSLLVFIGDLYLQQDFTQIRAAVSISLMLLCIKYIYSREGKKFLVCSLFAVFFHVSALIILPLWFLNAKKINITLCFVLIIASYILAICRFNPVGLLTYIPIPYIKPKVDFYLMGHEKNDYTANIFGLYFLMKIFLFSILLIKSKILIYKNKYAFLFLKVELASILSLLIFSQNLAAALRISEFYGSISMLLFPLFLLIFENEFIARVILVIICSIWIFLRIFRYNLIII